MSGDIITYFMCVLGPWPIKSFKSLTARWLHYWVRSIWSGNNSVTGVNLYNILTI
jgi:hypothetical protein